MSRDWNVESGTMGRFYYQLSVGTFGPKVRMGGGGGGEEECTKVRGQNTVKRNVLYIKKKLLNCK